MHTEQINELLVHLRTMNQRLDTLSSALDKLTAVVTVGGEQIAGAVLDGASELHQLNEAMDTGMKEISNETHEGLENITGILNDRLMSR